MIQDKIFFDEKDPTGVSYNTPFTVYGSYQGRLWSKTPTGSIKYYTQNSDLSVYATTGSNQFSGSQTVTGSLTVTGGITGSVTTASYVEYAGVANKPALVSGSSQVTYSGLTGVPSGIVSSSAQVGGYGIFATTGSNQFNGSQAVTGSLTVTGQVVAQTLNVQQVTSSIVFSSGSNIFGNSLGNTQQFTGSLQVTGSTHYLLGNVGVGVTSPLSKFHINTGTNQNFRVRPGTDVGATNGVALNSRTDDDGSLQQLTLRASDVIMLTSGNVGIGTASPSEKLEVQDGYLSTYHNINANDAGYGIQFYTNGGGSKNSLAYIGLSQVGTARSGNLTFQTSNAGAPSTKMTITSGGNVGVGAIPAAWASPTIGKVIQLGNRASVFSYNNGTLDLATNFYFDGSDYRYLESAFATLLRSDSTNNTFAFYNAASGTAGGVVPLTERMRLTSNGVLKIGNGGTTDDGLNPGYKNVAISFNDAANRGEIQAVQQQVLTYPLILNGAGGTVGIGTNSPASSTKLMVAGGIGFGNNTDGTANLSYGGRISAKSTSVTGGGGATLIHRGLGSVGYFILVSGLHSSNRFMDLIYGTGANTPIVLASNTENTAPTRTYSISGENIFVSLTNNSAVWTVTTTGLGAMEA